ncbi:MAG: 3-methyl-2-oxobutanoate hydroxymethyltransferase [Firmicutes bacterium]|nr:3-methyl-2-oxobutanoate hydroxymethyltransferase [Bacillota bacterium]MCL5039322.1 3-methyl-2-oxobutanoate hydroxymethyltransferase [Bacillota bacterium]
MREKVTITTLQAKKARGEKITMLTCYDYPTALLEEKAGVDILLVGDSLAMTVLGHPSTLTATMDVMIVHAQAVRRGAPGAFLIGDMPYMSYQISKKEAIRNAGRFMAEAGCDAVKLEGGRNMAEVVEALTKATIPVMGHLGLTPQSIAQLGGFKAQGRNVDTALRVIEDAKILEEAGAFAILLEAVPPEVGKIITKQASIPIISIGAGPQCDGQLLIVHDMLGFFDAFTPKFVKKYANLNETILQAFREYIDDVTSGRFPASEHFYNMKPGEAARLEAQVKDRNSSAVSQDGM